MVSWVVMVSGVGCGACGSQLGCRVLDVAVGGRQLSTAAAVVTPRLPPHSPASPPHLSPPHPACRYGDGSVRWEELGIFEGMLGNECLRCAVENGMRLSSHAALPRPLRPLGYLPTRLLPCCCLPPSPGNLLRGLVSCTGAQFCSLALIETKNRWGLHDGCLVVNGIALPLLHGGPLIAL